MGPNEKSDDKGDKEEQSQAEKDAETYGDENGNIGSGGTGDNPMFD